MVSPEMDRKLNEVTNTIIQRVEQFKSKQVPARQKVVLPENPSDAMKVLADAINESIGEAKNIGVSPEKLAPLYNSLKGVLEITAEIKGTLDRSTKIMNLTKIDLHKEIEEYAKAIELSR
jgi:hypothetical protein